MKKILWILCLLLVLIISSCENGTFGEEPLEIPEGAVKLTKFNFDDYFSIKLRSRNTSWFSDDTAEVSVSIVPKDFYQEVGGKIELKIESYVYSKDSSEPICNIVDENKIFELNNDVVNETFSIRLDEDDVEVNNYKNNAEIVKISGYVLVGEKPLNEIEKLTSEDYTNSNSVYEEVEALIDTWKPVCANAKNYQFDKSNTYCYSSIYNDDLSYKSGMFAEFSSSVDKENMIYSRGDERYIPYNNNTIYQEKTHDGRVRTYISGTNMEDLFEQSTFNFEFVMDNSCTYVKESDTVYYGYTTFDKMKSSTLKQDILAMFNSRRIKSNYDDIIFKYTYIITNDSLEVRIELKFKDYHFHIDYYELNHLYSQKIYNINNTTVELYSEEDYEFVLCHDLEDAVATKAGLVLVDSTTKEINFKVYNYDYSYDTPSYYDYENYLPIKITKGGVYRFDDNKYQIYDEFGDYFTTQSYDTYFPEGIYFIEVNKVSAGVHDRTINVSVEIFDDYGDLNNPILIENNSFSCHLEGLTDVEAFLFIPDKTGIYKLNKHENVFISVYDKDNLTDKIESLFEVGLDCYLEKGKSYVYKMENINYDGSVSYQGQITYIGEPTYDIVLSEEFSEILVFDGSTFDNHEFSLDIESYGKYKIEYEFVSGENISSFFIIDEEGEYLDPIEYIENYSDRIYVLEQGKYTVALSCWKNHVVLKIRLVKVN